MNIKITTPFIKLDQFLKFSGIAMTGGEAKLMITDGIVYVNGELAHERGKKIYPSDVVLIKADDGDITINIEG